MSDIEFVSFTLRQVINVLCDFPYFASGLPGKLSVFVGLSEAFISQVGVIIAAASTEQEKNAKVARLQPAKTYIHYTCTSRVYNVHYTIVRVKV